MSRLDNPFYCFAMDIDGPLQQARAEIIACYEMQNGANADEPCVQDAVQRLIASAYGRLDSISEAHAVAYELAGVEKSSVPDPFVVRLAVLERDVAAYNANPEAADDLPEPGGAFCDEMRSGKLEIGNVEGAILALRRTKAINCIIDTEGDILVDAVIAFLEGNAS